MLNDIDQFITRIIEHSEYQRWEITVHDIPDRPRPGYLPFTNGGKSVWIYTNLKDCTLPVTEYSRNYYDEGDWFEIPLYIKFNCFHFLPGKDHYVDIKEPTIVYQAYFCFDEYGRDNNYDIVGFGYSSNMTTKGLEILDNMDDTNPIKRADELFNYILTAPSEPLRPTKK